MKKYSLFIILIPLVVLVLFGFLYWKGISKEKIADIPQVEKSEKIIDIENTIIECKGKEKYFGKDLISRGINFQLIGSKLFYKGEELERLCNPQLEEYNYEAEPSFNIIPAYLKS